MEITGVENYTLRYDLEHGWEPAWKPGYVQDAHES